MDLIKRFIHFIYRNHKTNNWKPKWDYADVNYEYDKMIYVDKDGAPITGLLGDYWYFNEGDERNWQLVIDGKRVR